jgi:hypothetical protein
MTIQRQRHFLPSYRLRVSNAEADRSYLTTYYLVRKYFIYMENGFRRFMMTTRYTDLSRFLGFHDS